jgi:hypothetical protein
VSPLLAFATGGVVGSLLTLIGLWLLTSASLRRSEQYHEWR